MSEDEVERMNRTIEAATVDVFTVMARARTICKREYQRSPNWVLAMELFGLGSTYAHELCRRYEIEPDARTVFRTALTRSNKDDRHGEV